MISLFRKHIAPRPAVTSGLVVCLFWFAAGVSAHAQVATRTQLSANEAQSGTLSLTANISDVQGNPVTDGSVSFETSKGSLGSVFVHNGTATLNLTNPPAWARSITAVYHGGADFSSSQAGTAITADTASSLPGFTVTAAPSSLSLTAGNYGTISLTVTSQNGFSEPVNLSCSGLPNTSTCAFSPEVVTPPADGSIVSTLQLTTTAASGVNSAASLRQSRPLGGSGESWALIFPGILALAGIGAIRRRNFGALRVLGLVMLLGAGTLGLSSCSARYAYLHYKPAPNGGTAAGSYTVVVSAYSTNGTTITQATSSDASCSGAVCVALTVK
jgi:hypothetical protein